MIEPGGRRRDVRPLAGQSEGLAPAWIDATTVAVVQRDRSDRLFVAIVAAATGRLFDPLEIEALDYQTSRDSRTSAILTRDRIAVGPTASVLELRKAPDGGPATPLTDIVRGGIALSADGRYLAAAVEEGNPGRARVAIYERAGGRWLASIRVSSPGGANRRLAHVAAVIRRGRIVGAQPAVSGPHTPATGRQLGSASAVAVKIEICASSRSIWPRIFCRVS